MNTSIRSVLCAAVFLTAFVVSRAQVSDDFSSGDNWASSVSLLGNGSFAFSGGVANYVVSPATAIEFAYSRFTGAVGSYDSNWSVQINLSYTTPGSVFDNSVWQFINTGLMVTTTGASVGVNDGIPTFNAFMVTGNLYQSSIFESDIRTSTFLADQEPSDGLRYLEVNNVSGTTTFQLGISFDATTKVLTANYDVDGTGGAAPVTMDNSSIDYADTSTWNMVSGDTFSIYLVANSGFDEEIGSGVGPTLGLGDVTMDNFVGTNLSAVPEPSTYAALFGVCALGFAAWRRRQGRLVVA